MKYTLKIKPAILLEIRHKIQDLLEKEGFQVCGGGTHTDMSACDITFEDAESYSYIVKGGMMIDIKI